RLHALPDRRDVLARDDAALGAVDELEAAARLERLDAQHDVAVLPAPARLADELRLVLDRLANGLLVGDLRLADVGVDLELAQQAIDDDLQMELAHARDERLPGLGVGRDAEGRILGGELVERAAEALLVGLGLGLDGDRDDGVRELHALEHDRLRLVAEGVAGGRVAETDRGGDVARVNLLDLLALVGVHLQEPADALLLPLDRVVRSEERRAGNERSSLRSMAT